MKEQQQLFNKILIEWNPIGLDNEIAEDEYKGYIPLIKNSMNTQSQLISCLEKILFDMGLDYDKLNPIHKNDLQAVALKILSVKNLAIEYLTTKDIFLLEKMKEINQNKIPISKTEIPKLYDELFIDYSTNNNLECLKRAIFIQWYSVSEPIDNTGIGELNNVCQTNNLEKLKDLILNKTIDSEFLQMLNHYYNVSDWYFDSILNLDLSIDLASNSKSHIIMTEERGVMGKYWKSILNR